MKANVDSCWQIKNGRKTRSSREERALPPAAAAACGMLAGLLACLLACFFIHERIEQTSSSVNE